MAALPSETQRLLVKQAGVIGLWQMDPRTRRQVQRLVAINQAKRITWSTYALGCGEISRDQRLWAAYLHCGPEAVIGGRTALSAAGWRDDVHKSIHVLVPRGRQPRGNPDWLVTHRTAHVPAKRLGSLPRVDPHLAAVQASAWATSESEVLYVLTSAMQQRVITATRLLAEAQAQPRARRRVLAMEVADEFAAGMQSMNERRFAGLCHAFGLPEPSRQTRRVDTEGVWRSTDAEFTMRDGRTLIVEIDGLHHLEPLNWLDDIDRQNDLVLSVNGVVLRVATWTLKRNPGPFMAKIASVL